MGMGLGHSKMAAVELVNLMNEQLPEVTMNEATTEREGRVQSVETHIDANESAHASPGKASGASSTAVTASTTTKSPRKNGRAPACENCRKAKVSHQTDSVGYTY